MTVAEKSSERGRGGQGKPRSSKARPVKSMTTTAVDHSEGGGSVPSVELRSTGFNTGVTALTRFVTHATIPPQLHLLALFSSL